MEENQNAVTQTETVENKTEVAGEQPVEKTEKTYTQEEVNALDKKLKEKYEKKYAGIDLKKYKEWEDSQKTEAEKQTERAQEFAKLQAEKDSLEQLTKIYDAGVTGKDNVEFIQFKVSKMEGDFDENLKTYLDEHPKYLQKETDEEAPQTTGASVKKISNNAEDGVTAILKAKHPDIKF